MHLGQDPAALPSMGSALGLCRGRLRANERHLLRTVVLEWQELRRAKVKRSVRRYVRKSPRAASTVPTVAYPERNLSRVRTDYVESRPCTPKGRSSRTSMRRKGKKRAIATRPLLEVGRNSQVATREARCAMPEGRPRKPRPNEERDWLTSLDNFRNWLIHAV